jgi:hypothetical protein
LNKIQTLTLTGIVLSLAVWTPIGYTGLTRTDAFSIHAVHMMKFELSSSQYWIDQYGQHYYRDYGYDYFVWNTSNIVNGYHLESYNFSNIPNVSSAGWEFEAIIVKVQNGVPAYEDVSPNVNGPVYPFDGTNFQMQIRSTSNCQGQWQGNPISCFSTIGNETLPFPDWPSGSAGFNDGVDINTNQVFQNIPKSTTAELNFTANWHVQGTVVSPDAGLSNYNIGFDQSVSMLMVVRNGTILSAAWNSYVHTDDSSPVSVTYRTISPSTALYATIGIVVVASIVILVVFRRELRNGVRRLTGHGTEGAALPGISETPKSSPSLG